MRRPLDKAATAGRALRLDRARHPRRATTGRGFVLGILAIVAAGAVGCARPERGPAVDGQPEARGAARSEAERGPVRVTVRVEPAKARLSDELTLTLRMDCQQGVTLRKPPFGESLGDFLVRDFREPLPRVEGDREIVQQVYRLEPTRAGKLSIWPIRVTFLDTRPDGDGKEHTVETEGLTVEVASVLDTDLPSLTRLKPAAGPLELPEPPGTGAWWLAAAMILAAGGVGVVGWVCGRRRRAATVRSLSPHELAALELERLQESKLAEEDVKLFYVELTGVVRRSIERTTGIRAPEQTTEEFLGEISHTDTFPADEARRLRLFLETADLVKFAAHRPEPRDVAESFERARRFLGLERREAPG